MSSVSAAHTKTGVLWKNSRFFVLSVLLVGCAAGAARLFQHKGLTVCTLGCGGVHFVCAYHDLVERAEVFAFCMVSALLNGAGDTAIGLLVFHN